MSRAVLSSDRKQPSGKACDQVYSYSVHGAKDYAYLVAGAPLYEVTRLHCHLNSACYGNGYLLLASL
jgi:hypothetical protein